MVSLVFVMSLLPLFLPHTHLMIKTELKQLLLSCTGELNRAVPSSGNYQPTPRKGVLHSLHHCDCKEIKEEMFFSDTLLMTEPFSLIQIFPRQHNPHKQSGCTSPTPCWCSAQRGNIITCLITSELSFSQHSTSPSEH